MDSLRGQLLIAGPGLVDPNFWRTVVLVGGIRRKARSAVLNRSSETPVGEAVPELASLVERDGRRARRRPGAAVSHHRARRLRRASGRGCARRRVRRFLPAEVDPSALGPLRRARVYVGYAGWGPGQLDDELDEGSWIVEPALADDVFTDEPDELWSGVLRRKVARSASSPRCRRTTSRS